ncbi:MAG: hypothetical protein RR672_11555 [Raoultibacter sp.]
MLSLYETSAEVELEQLFRGNGPFISMYLPTHRITQDIKLDKLVLKNLIKEAEESLAKNYEKREYQSIIDELTNLIDDPDETLWRHAKDGLALLACQGKVFGIKLSYPVEPRTIVAKSFHIKPLIKGLQFGSCYYLLSLSKERYDLYRGDVIDLDKVPLPQGYKNEFTMIYDDFDNDSSLNAGSFGGQESGYHGHRTKSEEDEKDREKFFRHVDKEVATLVEPHENIPVILATLTQHQSEFRDLSTLSNLLDEGLEKPVESMSEQDLKDGALKIIGAAQDARIDHLAANFGNEQAAERATTDIRTIGNALVERKVETLLIEEGVTLPGSFDGVTGAIALARVSDADTDDVTDDFAQATLLQGGAVFVVDPDKMPGETGVAAYFRY